MTKNEEKNIMLSVFSVTYNRADILEKLHISLEWQSMNDFECVLVDDRFTVNTITVNRTLIAGENDFVIRYFKKVKGGKYTAINLGLEHADVRENFFTVDSDDYLTYNAFEKVSSWLHKLNYNKMDYNTFICNCN